MKHHVIFSVEWTRVLYCSHINKTGLQLSVPFFTVKKIRGFFLFLRGLELTTQYYNTNFIMAFFLVRLYSGKKRKIEALKCDLCVSGSESTLMEEREIEGLGVGG